MMANWAWKDVKVVKITTLDFCGLLDMSYYITTYFNRSYFSLQLVSFPKYFSLVTNDSKKIKFVRKASYFLPSPPVQPPCRISTFRETKNLRLIDWNMFSFMLTWSLEFGKISNFGQLTSRQLHLMTIRSKNYWDKRLNAPLTPQFNVVWMTEKTKFNPLFPTLIIGGGGRPTYLKMPKKAKSLIIFAPDCRVLMGIRMDKIEYHYTDNFTYNDNKDFHHLRAWE